MQVVLVARRRVVVPRNNLSQSLTDSTTSINVSLCGFIENGKNISFATCDTHFGYFVCEMEALNHTVWEWSGYKAVASAGNEYWNWSSAEQYCQVRIRGWVEDAAVQMLTVVTDTCGHAPLKYSGISWVTH